jgi:hypothetical protein
MHTFKKFEDRIEIGYHMESWIPVMIVRPELQSEVYYKIALEAVNFLNGGITELLVSNYEFV